MKKGIHNYSEIGKLNRVLLHRPGREVEALTPATMERLLFDDVPYLKEAQKEHDQFAKVLKDNGVEVIYYEKETAKALKETAVREEFVSNMIELSFIESEGMKQAIRSFLMSLEPEKMVEEIISGVSKDGIAVRSCSDRLSLCHGSDAQLVFYQGSGSVHRRRYQYTPHAHSCQKERVPPVKIYV